MSWLLCHMAPWWPMEGVPGRSVATVAGEASIAEPKPGGGHAAGRAGGRTLQRHVGVEPGLVTVLVVCAVAVQERELYGTVCFA